MYAIVDIETTGSYANGNGITEIAIRIHNGTDVVQQYDTLINPQADIPVYIQALTGITNEMVARAPAFEEVASEIFNLLNGNIFVAHNVNFDYSFLKHQLSRSGFDLQCNKLCTVRLSRKLLPGMPSYSLGKLCMQLGINNYSRHRAGGDVDATATLFGLLLQKDTENHIAKALKLKNKEQTLPPNLSITYIDNLPYAPGVYYFHDNKGKVIYVGKAKNIKKRVCSHFIGNNVGRQRQEFLRNIFSITYQICGTELMAFILEALEIKKLWPKYNRSLKRFEHAYALYDYVDQLGYVRLAIDKYRKHQTPIYTCNTLYEGYNLLHQLIDTFELCPKLCFIQKNTQVCNGVHTEKCACTGIMPPSEYNELVKTALDSLTQILPTFAIRDEGRTHDEHSCILIEKGKFYGMGYVSHYADINNLYDLKPLLTAYPSNDYIKNLISGYAVKYPERKLIFQ